MYVKVNTFAGICCRTLPKVGKYEVPGCCAASNLRGTTLPTSVGCSPSWCLSLIGLIQ